MELRDEDVERITTSLMVRGSELDAFLKAAGILVVMVQPDAVLWARSRTYQGRTSEIASTSWLIASVPELLYVVAGGHRPFMTGSGQEIVVREFDHPLAAVIRDASGYSGRIAGELFQIPEPIVLATTRIDDPIAAEITAGAGLVLLVPSGVDESQLSVALEGMLDTRERHRQTWMLPDEAALIEAENAVRSESREKLASLAAQARVIGDLRMHVMKDVNVVRAISYYENGTSATRPIQRAMQDLYKLVDMLEDYFGGSEDKLATGLGVSKSLFKEHIKKLANQKQLDFRHAQSGETVGADAAEIVQARRDARDLVQRFIEYCCNEERQRRSASEGRQPAEAAAATGVPLESALLRPKPLD